MRSVEANVQASCVAAAVSWLNWIVFTAIIDDSLFSKLLSFGRIAAKLAKREPAFLQGERHSRSVQKGGFLERGIPFAFLLASSLARL